MTDGRQSLGITRRGNKYLAARVAGEGARLRVISLAALEESLPGHNLNGGRLFCGVEQRLAVTKRVEVKKPSPGEELILARFELEQSLPEDAAGFYFDFVPLADSGHQCYLSIAYHKSMIDKLMADYTSILHQPSGFKLDAVALAIGYLKFCRQEPGDLQILLDLDSDAVVIAVVYRQSLCAIDYLALVAGEDITLDRARPIVTDLRLMVDFHLTELFREGITVPLSKIILSGRWAGQPDLINALTEKFSTEITPAHVNEGYLENNAVADHSLSARQFLIPLGLAVE